MRTRVLGWALTGGLLAASPALLRGGDDSGPKIEFRTSDRCVACHNGLKTSSGQDISIGLDWRASVMANSSRDPYWQASVRRETIDHPDSALHIEGECSICHMPVSYKEAKIEGKDPEIFSHLPFDPDKKGNAAAEDGITCSLCHQISKYKLDTPASFNGEFVIETPRSADRRQEYGPFDIDAAHQRVMQSSTGGYVPVQAAHMRDSALCGSCHTLYTTSIGKDGKPAGTLPEQMPYLEYLHSDYPARSTCQSCHMPEVQEPVPITAILGQPRQGMHRHVFIAGNFPLQHMLNQYRDELGTAALPQELTAAANRTINFLQTQAARIEIRNLETTSGVQFDVAVRNLGGHKLPTAFPSRRAWLHVVVRDRDGRAIFESGALNPDGSIVGNLNDSDPRRFSPHYREITSPRQVEIYESILKDTDSQVTTGLLAAIGYAKDNRILPTGFDKSTAKRDIEVVGDAAADPSFNDRGSVVRYKVSTGAAAGPFQVEAELWYQPVGYRWAHNLAPYTAAETRRFVSYYEAMSAASAVALAKAHAVR